MARSSSTSVVNNFRPGRELAMFILAMLGLVVVFHLWIQKGRGFDQGCWGFNPPTEAAGAPTFNCSAVVYSDAGTIFGISNVYWGGLFYAVVAGLTLLVGLSRGAALDRLKTARLGMAGIGFLYSLYLIYYQVTLIGEYCALCLTSAAIVIVLFTLMALDYLAARGHVRRRTAEAADAAPRGTLLRYLPVVVVAAALVVADIAYFRTLGAPKPSAPAGAVASAEGCYYDNQERTVPNYAEFVSAGDPVKGNPQASVTVIEFFDPNCPHCATLYPVMDSVMTTHGDRARFVYKPIALWDISRGQVAALMIAAEEGKFFEMLEAQFAAQQQGGLSEEQVRQIAANIGMDVDAMAAKMRAGGYAMAMDREVSRLANLLSRFSVPRVWINGKTVGVRSAECLREHIEAEAAAPAS